MEAEATSASLQADKGEKTLLNRPCYADFKHGHEHFYSMHAGEPDINDDTDDAPALGTAGSDLQVAAWLYPFNTTC